MRPLTNALVLLLFLAGASARAQDPSEAPCVDPADLRLGGVALGARLDETVASVGDPDSVAAGIGEDDGGLYIGATLTYGPLEVEIVRDHVDVVRTESAAVEGPLGMRVGMPKRDVERRTGAEAVPGADMDSLDPEALWVPVCYGPNHSPAVDGGLVVGFDESGRAVSVSVVALRP